MRKKVIKLLLVLAPIFATIPISSSRRPNASAIQQQDMGFEVDISETLSINITTPSNWASGSAGTFLRNKVTIDIISNNAQGFTASMIASDTNAELKHSSKNTSISTLNSGTSYTCTNNTTCPEFPNNKWGYTVDDGVNSNVYYPMVGSSNSPISLISNAESTQQSPVTSRDIYFGARSDISQTSGTYSGTVIFYVVSGAVVTEQEQEQEQETPSNSPEVTPAMTTDDIVSYSSPTTTNDTVSTATSTTTTSHGSTLDSYQEPAGVTSSSDIHDGSILSTALAITASVATISGITLFVIAKNKKDDDEEEAQQ